MITDLLERQRKRGNLNKNAIVNQRESIGHSNLTLQGYYSGAKKITEDQIYGIPAAFAALEIITSAVGQLPINLYVKEEDKKDYTSLNDDPRIKLLNTNANEILSGVDFKKRMVKDILLHGSFKAVIERDEEGNPTGIYPLDMEKLSTTVYSDDGYKFFGVSTLLSMGQNSDFYDELLFTVLRNNNDGIIGRGVIEGNEDIFTLAMQQLEYESNLVGNGAIPTGLLKTTEKNPKDSTLERLRQGFQSLYSGSKNSGKTIVLPGDLDYQSLSLNPDDLQLTAGKKGVISDIARIFNIPESMINSAANKYDSTEQNNLWFLTYTLSPLLSSIEIALNRNFLTKEERDAGFEYKFDTSSVSRITPTELQKNVTDAFNNGVITNIAAKRKLNETILPDEPEYYKLTTGSVMYMPETDRIINPNLGQIMDYKTGRVVGDGYGAGGASDTTSPPDNTNNDDGGTVDEQSKNGN